MVLVSKKPSSDLGILQTKLSDRERHQTRRVGLEAIPLDEDIEGGHGEGQARLKIGPAPVHDLFEMANERQHREHRLDEHTVKAGAQFFTDEYNIYHCTEANYDHRTVNHS